MTRSYAEELVIRAFSVLAIISSATITALADGQVPTEQFSLNFERITYIHTTMEVIVRIVS